MKRGLKGSGSAESVNRLAVIMLLTLSIVTLAAVQGYTGTLVDEKTVDASVGSDLKIQMEQEVGESTIINIVKEYASGANVNPIATSVPELTLYDASGGENLQTFVLFDDNEDVLKWSDQALPGEDVSKALSYYQAGGFSAGTDAAYALDLPGSERGGDENRLDDQLLKSSDEKSENITFTWDKIVFNFSSGGAGESDPEELFLAYTELMEGDWSGLNLSGQDLNERDLGRVDLSGTNLSGADLSNVNLSESILFDVNLSNTNLTGANLENTIIVNFRDGTMEGADFTNANLNGMFGLFEFGNTILSNTTCPDGNNSSVDSCATGPSPLPTPLAAPLFLADTSVRIEVTKFSAEMFYMGVHQYIPGVSSPVIESTLIIGESKWRSLVGQDAVDYNSTTWIVRVDGVSGDALESLASKLEADSRVSETVDWSSTHKEVERNGGLIFGTPGLLSLQFVVASVAAVASSFVFLSLVLNQRQKELAVLQAIGASPTQIIRLVLFEILSIVMVSMALGVVLGVALALSFNGFFDIFGFIFQIFGGSSTTIERDLVYPWTQIVLVSLAVFVAVVVALLVTTRKALKADLASVLKGE